MFELRIKMLQSHKTNPIDSDPPTSSPEHVFLYTFAGIDKDD